MEIEKNISKKLFNPIKLPREIKPSILGGDSVYFLSAFTEKPELIEYQKSASSDRDQENGLRELKK